MFVLILGCAVVMVLLALGTLNARIPVLSSFANTITVTGAHLYLVGQTLVLAVAMWYPPTMSTVNRVILIGVILACVGAQVFMLWRMLRATKAAGVPVRFSRAYWPRIIRGVSTRTYTYDTQLPNSLLKVFYCDDGKANKPVVIYTHGGGWFYGSKEDRTYYHRHAATEGCVVVSIDYALSDAHHHYAGQTEQQLLRGLDWVLANISQFNGQVDRWTFAGDSAGGNLALNLAFKINAGLYTQPDSTPYPAVSAVCVTYPVADPVGFYHNPDLIMGAVTRYSARSYTGGTPEEQPEVYASITPGQFITPNAPAVSIVLGTQDAAVPHTGSLALVNQLNAVGVRTHLVAIPYANHACDTFWGSIASEAYIHAARVMRQSVQSGT
ncbi:alpha/beta hydrolase [Stomatohabitans albus]|uniref:alpha/beta hydrolase n=1 Tax=Stomatohabitans albus TaxID=3110766 RepID=UPI00300CECB0